MTNRESAKSMPPSICGMGAAHVGPGTGYDGEPGVAVGAALAFLQPALIGEERGTLKNRDKADSTMSAL